MALECEECQKKAKIYTFAGLVTGVVLGVGAFYLVSRRG